MAPELNLSGAERDTLNALIEQGPLWDGDVPSKTGRDMLLRRGFAVRVVVKANDGYTAATYAGRDAYKALHSTSLGGVADTIQEAFANKVAARTIAKSMRNS